MVKGVNFTMEEALELGLVNEVLEGDDFMQQVMKYASQFCTPDKAAMSVGHIKRAVQSGAEVALESGLALERELQAKLFASEDAKEGLTAYNQKRKAEFKGR